MNTFFKLVLASVLVLAVIFTVGLRSFHFGSDDRGRVYFSIEEVHNNAKAVSNAISARYKAPDGGWWMPFEMYEAIPSPYGTENPIKSPVLVDINGDSLPDLLFSAYEEPKPPVSALPTDFGYMSQYIALNQGNSWRLVYSCRQQMVATGADLAVIAQNIYPRPTHNPNYYLYYGDCADPNYPYNPSSYSSFNPYNLSQYSPPFSPAIIAQHGPRGLVLPPQATFYGAQSVAISQYVQHLKCWTYVGTQSYQSPPHSCARSLPKLTDIDGDGFLDVVMSGSIRTLTMNPIETIWHRRFTTGSVALNFVLYGTGTGFVLTR